MAHKNMRPNKHRGIQLAFTPDQELVIAQRVLIGREKQYVIAAALGVHRNTISNICRRRRSEVMESAPLPSTEAGPAQQGADASRPESTPEVGAA